MHQDDTKWGKSMHSHAPFLFRQLISHTQNAFLDKQAHNISPIKAGRVVQATDLRLKLHLCAVKCEAVVCALLDRRFFGFRRVATVEGDKLKDLPHMLVRCHLCSVE